MRRLFASITARVRGTLTRATATSAGCSSYSELGLLSEGVPDPTWPLHENSFIVHTSCGAETAAPGSSGAPGTSAEPDRG